MKKQYVLEESEIKTIINNAVNIENELRMIINKMKDDNDIKYELIAIKDHATEIIDFLETGI
jgi:hypothetical protein